MTSKYTPTHTPPQVAKQFSYFDLPSNRAWRSCCGWRSYWSTLSRRPENGRSRYWIYATTSGIQHVVCIGIRIWAGRIIRRRCHIIVIVFNCFLDFTARLTWARNRKIYVRRGWICRAWAVRHAPAADLLHRGLSGARFLFTACAGQPVDWRYLSSCSPKPRTIILNTFFSSSRVSMTAHFFASMRQAVVTLPLTRGSTPSAR
jgi:hypothetical protein